MIHKFILALAWLVFGLTMAIDNCPKGCACLWKSGKETTECIQQDLEEIPASIDKGTQVLDLRGNLISSLDDNHFMNLGITNLQRIYFSDCRISEVAPLAFRRLTNLVELDLSGNELMEVPTESWSHALSLMRLHMGSNPIKLIRAGAFRQLRFVNYLNLARCQIETLEDGAFDGMDSLKELRLEGNKLNYVPGTNLFPKSLTHVELHSNRFHCDCRLLDFAHWIQHSKIPMTLEPMCHLPLRLTNRTISGLDLATELACLPQVQIQGTQYATIVKSDTESVKTMDVYVVMIDGLDPSDGMPNPALMDSGLDGGTSSSSSSRSSLESNGGLFLSPSQLSSSTSLESSSEIDFGKTVSLRCSVFGIPSASVSWWHYNTLVANNSAIVVVDDTIGAQQSTNSVTAPRYNVVQHRSNNHQLVSELILLSVSPGHEGTYFCSATNPAGVATKNVTIHLRSESNLDNKEVKDTNVDEEEDTSVGQKDTLEASADEESDMIKVEYILGFGAAVVIVLTIIIILILYLILQCRASANQRGIKFFGGVTRSRNALSSGLTCDTSTSGSLMLDNRSTSDFIVPGEMELTTAVRGVAKSTDASNQGFAQPLLQHSSQPPHLGYPEVFAMRPPPFDPAMAFYLQNGFMPYMGQGAAAWGPMQPFRPMVPPRYRPPPPPPGSSGSGCTLTNVSGTNPCLLNTKTSFSVPISNSTSQDPQAMNLTNQNPLFNYHSGQMPFLGYPQYCDQLPDNWQQMAQYMAAFSAATTTTSAPSQMKPNSANPYGTGGLGIESSSAVVNYFTMPNNHQNFVSSAFQNNNPSQDVWKQQSQESMNKNLFGGLKRQFSMDDSRAAMAFSDGEAEPRVNLRTSGVSWNQSASLGRKRRSSMTSLSSSTKNNNQNLIPHYATMSRGQQGQVIDPLHQKGPIRYSSQPFLFAGNSTVTDNSYHPLKGPPPTASKAQLDRLNYKTSAVITKSSGSEKPSYVQPVSEQNGNSNDDYLFPDLPPPPDALLGKKESKNDNLVAKENSSLDDICQWVTSAADITRARHLQQMKHGCKPMPNLKSGDSGQFTEDNSQRLLLKDSLSSHRTSSSSSSAGNNASTTGTCKKHFPSNTSGAVRVNPSTVDRVIRRPGSVPDLMSDEGSGDLPLQQTQMKRTQVRGGKILQRFSSLDHTHRKRSVQGRKKQVMFSGLNDNNEDDDEDDEDSAAEADSAPETSKMNQRPRVKRSLLKKKHANSPQDDIWVLRSDLVPASGIDSCGNRGSSKINDDKDIPVTGVVIARPQPCRPAFANATSVHPIRPVPPPPPPRTTPKLNTTAPRLVTPRPNPLAVSRPQLARMPRPPGAHLAPGQQQVNESPDEGYHEDEGGSEVL